MNSLLRPRAIFGYFAISLVALFFAGVLPPRVQPDLGARSWLFVIRAAAGYSVALALCIRVAREHRSDSWLRFCWAAFAVNAAASIGRHLADTPLWNLIWPGYSRGVEIALIRQTFIVIGMGGLLAGAAAMVWGFHRVGIGLSPKRRDLAAIAGVFTILAVTFYFREGLAEAKSASGLARHLQQLGLILLAASAACSILVYRLSRWMSGGRLAVTMLYIVLYTVLRCILVCISLFPSMNRAIQPLLIPLDFSVPWLFALAAAYRSGIAVHGASRIPRSSPVTPYLRQTFPVS